MSQSNPPVSVFVVAGNEELNIEACLRSVHGWSDDIHVVDSDSTDKTVELSRRFTANVVNHTYVDHASQLMWAFDNLPFKHEWVLFLDADNVVSDLLKQKIAKSLASDDGTVSGYYCIHTEFFRDKPVWGMKKWWARLVRRTRCRIDNSELVDYGIKIDGDVGYIHAAIYENNRKENDIDFWIDKHQRFARRMAAEEVLRKHGLIAWGVAPRLFGTSDQRRVWLKKRWLHMPLFIRPIIYWVYRYFLRGAVFQGRHGFTFTVFQALWFRLLCDMKVQEFQQQLLAGTLSLDDLWSQFGSKSPKGDIVGKRDSTTGKT